MNRLLFDIDLLVLQWHREIEGSDDAPMASAVVTYKNPSNRIPGPGFWALAREIETYGYSPGWMVLSTNDSARLVAFWDWSSSALCVTSHRDVLMSSNAICETGVGTASPPTCRIGSYG